MEKYDSIISFDYDTIKITKSRINKRLLAIPISLIEFFPKEKTKIYVLLEDDKTPQPKNFTPYTSSTKETRIGGLAKWFDKMKFKDGDEIVIQFINIDDRIYSLRKENKFLNEVKKIDEQLTQSLGKENVNEKESNEIVKNIETLSNKVNKPRREIIINQFLKISDLPIKPRQYKNLSITQRKENVPNYIRFFLEDIYHGRCQLTNFTFIQKNGKPFFEIHHIDNNRGNDYKNLIVVSPNIHAQFTYAEYDNIFDKEGWLRKVRFGEYEYNVNHILDKMQKRKFEKVVHT